MYSKLYQVPVRSEWSEFSLRRRPPKIKRFQAGLRSNSNDEESSLLSRKTERDLLRRQPSFRNENIKEDSIEFDVFTIAMSYPEGQQRILDKLDKMEQCKKDPQPSNSSSEKGDCVEGQKISETLPDSRTSSKGHSKGRPSKSLSKDKPPRKNGSKKDNSTGNCMEKKEGTDRLDLRSKSHSETKERSRSSSPVIEKVHGRRMFTMKERFEKQKKEPRFSLRDILGKRADESKLCESVNKDVDRKEQIGVLTENENLYQVELNETGNSSQIPEMFFSDSFTENVDGLDAWIDEIGSNEDGSLLAMLNSPLVDDNSNNNKYSSDTEVDSDDARYYYENMVNWKESNHGNSNKTWSNGSLVWGKLSKTRWWPGIIIDGSMAGQATAKIGWTWLMWFGDHKISQMRLSQVVSFAHQFRQHSRGRLSTALENAVVEALMVCADRADVSLDGYNNVRKWGFLEMGFLDLVDATGKDVDPFGPKVGSEFPVRIVKELRKLRDQNDFSDFYSDEEMEMTSEPAASGIGKVETTVLKDVEFCLSCAKYERKIVGQHPVFEGFVCIDCKEALLESLLAQDKDGCYLFCAVCGEGGGLYVCEGKDCGRSFCTTCMRRYLGSDALKLVRGRSPWLCFLCTKYSLESHGVLVPREGWQDELVKFFNPVVDQLIPSYDPACNTGRKLRVLSLFDGIGCARLALDQLNLNVEAYYAAENDASAQHVSLYNQGFAIFHLGDFDNITIDKVKAICPIDLVIGFPPPKDLDVTNREYEGFNGTGMFLFRFLSILKDIQAICHCSNFVYWLVESTATMKSEYRRVLTNFFEKEPCMWDAQFCSPYIQPKLYWGNIPGLYSSFQYYKDNKEQFPTLERYLAGHVNRSPQVDKLRNCAIGVQFVGSAEDEEGVDPGRNEVEQRVQAAGSVINLANSTMYSKPVLMDGKKGNIWPIEVERVLGLPIHYTDVSRITLTQRQALLKTAPSVHLLKQLLSPLTEIFLTHV